MINVSGQYKPHFYSSAFNPVVWSFNSNEAGRADFSYVVDIYVNPIGGTANAGNVYTYRLKQRPNRAGFCQIDVSSIIQPYVRLTNWAAEGGSSEPYKLGTDFTPAVWLKVGEEYSGVTGGTPTIFNGYGQTGSPAVFMGSREIAQVPVYCVPAAIPNLDQMISMTQSSAPGATKPWGFFQSYIMGGATGGATGTGKFLSRAGTTLTIGQGQAHTVSFLNFNPRWYNWQGATGGVTSDVTTVGLWMQLAQINYYNSSGSLLATQNINNIQSEGGGPSFSADYTSGYTAVQGQTWSYLALQCGTDGSLNIPSGTSSYTLQLFYKDSATGATAPQRPASELLTFNIVDYCEDLYPVVRLSWLNDLGGRDYYNFDMFYEKTSSSTQQEYSPPQFRYDRSTPTPVLSDVNFDPLDSNTYELWLRGGAKSFNKVITRRFTIQSDWLLQSQVEFLGGAAESPSVWAYISGDQAPYTVTITNTEYTYKNVKQTKLVQVSFDCLLTKNQPKQNL